MEKFEALINCNAGDVVETVKGDTFKFVKLNL